MEKMHYSQPLNLDTMVHRNSGLLFEPRLCLRLKDGATKIDYYGYNQRPSLLSLVPRTDDSDLLSRTINNPNLKDAYYHNLSLYHRININNNATLWIENKTSIEQNSIGMRTLFDPQTGVYTYMKDNVNGNWNTRMRTGWHTPIDKERLFRLDITGDIRFIHSVDFAISHADEGINDALSKVNTLKYGIDSKFSFRKNQLSITAIAKASATSARSRRENFQNIDACDLQYGLNATYTIPLIKLTAATDITMFSRRGYNAAEMNTDDLVWNAQLTRPFCKGRLIARIQAFDILHQVTNKKFSVNSQGRTETWYNSIPNYLMFSMAVQLSKKVDSMIRRN